MKNHFCSTKEKKNQQFFVIKSVYKIGLDKTKRETWDQYTLFITVFLCNIVLQIAKSYQFHKPPVVSDFHLHHITYSKSSKIVDITKQKQFYNKCTFFLHFSSYFMPTYKFFATNLPQHCFLIIENIMQSRKLKITACTPLYVSNAFIAFSQFLH